MNQQKRVSLCITTYNRPKETIRAFSEVVDDPRIDEIIISDDASLHKQFKELEAFVKEVPDIGQGQPAKKLPTNGGVPKITLTRNRENSGVYKNKYYAIDGAANDWCILLDSDNVIGLDYLDTLYALDKWDKKTVYLPSFARETFDYRRFAGRIITRENVGDMMNEPMFDCLINTMNGFYYRTAYIDLWNTDFEPGTADSMYMNYLFLAAGYKLYVVPDLEYIHTVHDGSHYKQNSHRYEKFKQNLLEKYKALS